MTLKQQYEAELKRIQQQIKRLEKRGFEFAKPVLPKRPKRIRRESVGRLQKIDLPTIKKKATVTPPPKRPKAKVISAPNRRATPKVAMPDPPKTGRFRQPDPPRTGRKPNPLRTEYAKNRRRIKQFVQRAQKRGYVVPDDIVPAVNLKPTEEDVARVRSITPNELYKRIYGVDASTGEAIPGDVERTNRRKEAARRAAETRKLLRETKNIEKTLPPKLGELVLDNVERQIAQFDPSIFRSTAARLQHYENNNKLRGLLDQAIAVEGRVEVGERLFFTGAELAYSTVSTIQYDSDQGNVEVAIAAFSSWILGRPLTQEEAESIGESYESYNEY